MSPYDIGLFCCGIFFLLSLLTGIWKYHGMMHAARHQAHRYVDVAHQTSLAYTFACLVLAIFAQHSTFPEVWNYLGISLPIIFFFSAVARYSWLGYQKKTVNQFRKKTMFTTVGMYLLILGEIGGFLILFLGYVRSLFLNGSFY